MAARKQKPKPRGASRTSSASARQPVPGWIWLVAGAAIGGFFVFLSQLKPGGEEIKRAPAEKPEIAAKPATPAQPASPPKPKYDFYTLLPESQGSSPAGAQVQPTPEQIQAVDAARAQALLEGRTPPPPLAPAPAPVKPSQPAPQPVAKPSSTAPAASPTTSPTMTTATATKATSTPATPTPSAAKPAAAQRFVLQAGSFANREQAESARAKLILLGQDARIESGKVGDKTWHRVVVGPFTSRPQADAAQKQLGAGGVSSVVQRR
ncbi:SPOR domain-containing protein [Pseudomonas sp. GCM10022188]|uniref:SPOR domain-containing protein n=1 Tax=Pseudomonas TaxID=286 RepID=UPI001E425EA6|nr:SPOR domain-containing protein [Pseudomonas oryzagri]MCC6076352.1 SPOR domain-containing protein [Pseudomonas oryzagri]